MHRKKIVAILYPGCVFNEISLALEILAKDFEVEAATADGQRHQASNGLWLEVTHSYSSIDLTSCAAILIPGGDPGSIREDRNIDKLLKDANAKGILIAAICAGPFLLAKAGILSGKRIAHGYQARQLEHLKSYFENAILTGEQVVTADNVITAKPEAFIDFAVEIACRLNVVNAAHSGRLRDYYKGILGKKIRPLALAYIQRPNGQFLLHKAEDRIKNEKFYRPLGGGIEFGELGSVALEREISEELNLKATVGKLIASFENIFSYEGKPGHEIIMLYSAKFEDASIYELEELDIVESGQVIAKATWRSVSEIRAEGAKLYPMGIEVVLPKD